MCPRLPMHSSSFLGETYDVPEGVRVCRIHGNVFVLSLGGEYDTGTSMCLPGSRPPTAALCRSVEETPIPTCSGTIRKWRMNTRSMLKTCEAYRQDLYGYVYHDIVRLPPSRYGSFLLFHPQDYLECMTDHDIVTLGSV